MESKLFLENVPALISYISLNYYYHGEYFSKYGQQVKLSKNNMTVTKIKQLHDRGYYDRNNTTYGNTWIDTNIPQIATWRLKLSMVEEGVIYFCMLSKDNQVDGACIDWNDRPCYAFGTNNGGAYYPSGCKFNNCWFKVGVDNISIILNTKKKTVDVKDNESSNITTVYKDLEIGDKIRYKLGIILHKPGDSATMIDFDLHLQ